MLALRYEESYQKNWAVTPTKSKNEIVNNAIHSYVKRRI
jgi:hypothetical protein